MSTVMDSLPDRFRPIVTSLLQQRDPELLAAFQAQEKPTLDQQEAMIDVLGDAFTEHFGPGYEPTEQGNSSTTPSARSSPAGRPKTSPMTDRRPR